MPGKASKTAIAGRMSTSKVVYKRAIPEKRDMASRRGALYLVS